MALARVVDVRMGVARFVRSCDMRDERRSASSRSRGIRPQCPATREQSLKLTRHRANIIHRIIWGVRLAIARVKHILEDSVTGERSSPKPCACLHFSEGSGVLGLGILYGEHMFP